MNDRPASSQSSPRLYYLDALRVIAILIVFLFHAVHPYDMWDWHIKNIEQSLTLTIFITILALWGMPFFFLVAGAGSWFALRRRTPKQYAVERTKRLLVPFLFGTLIVYVYTQYFQWDNQVYRGVTDAPFAQYILESLRWYLTLGFTPRLGSRRASVVPGLPVVFCPAQPAALPVAQGRERPARFLTAWPRCVKNAGPAHLFHPAGADPLPLSPFFPDEHNWSDFLFQGSFFILGYFVFASERIPAL